MDLVKPVLFLFGARWAFNQYSGALETIGLPLALRLISYAASVVLIGGGALWKYQESLLYIPNIRQPSGETIKTPADNPKGMKSPEEQGMPYTDLKLKTSDGIEVHGWFMPAKEGAASAPTLLFAHENAGNIGLRLPEYKLLHEHVGVNILAYDYRGYGYSDEAEINEAGLMRDARAAWAWLDEAASTGLIDKRSVFLFGRSLGGAVTIQLASELFDPDRAAGGGLRPAGMIVSNSFTSIEEMVGAVYPMLNWRIIKERLLRLEWRSVDHIRRVALPMLLIRGLRDEITPAGHMLKLRDAAAAAPSVVVQTVEDGTHNDTWVKAGALYPRWLAAFVREHRLKD